MAEASRIRQARELRGLTQTALAEKVGVSQAAVSQFEAGLTQPEEATLVAMAKATQVPYAFLQREAPLEFPAGSLLFRARADMTLRQEREIYQSAAISFELAAALRGQTTAIPSRVPRLNAAPEAAAVMTRTLLGLNPHGPVPNVVDAMERGGVLVIALPSAMPKREAFATWAGPDLTIPVVVMCPAEQGDRLRFSAAHELGHLVLHSGAHTSPRAGLRALEAEANVFAGALLLPADDFRLELEALGGPTLENFVRLKPRWRASIQSMIMRARNLELITDGQRTYLFQQLVKRGWRRVEPVHIRPEKPRALRKMAELVYRNPPDVARMAADHSLFREDVAKILGGYATLAEMPRRAAPQSPPPRQARSKVVDFARRRESSRGEG